MSAGRFPIPPPTSPVFRAQKVNPPTMAMAPVARLMMPEPR
jgi:hypothetical protein